LLKRTASGKPSQSLASISITGKKRLQPGVCLSPRSPIPKTGKPKINPKKLASFSRAKTTTQTTTRNPHFTTNSPQFHHHKTRQNRKTPSKNHPFSRQKFFCKNNTCSSLFRHQSR